MSGKYFPNNYEFVKACEFNEMGYKEFMENLSSWSIPSSHACLMRVENTDTGKIKEYQYKTETGAAKKIIALADNPSNVITIVDNETIHLLIHPDNDSVNY
tara:strand:+ start:312 stop:614 length:303 start_codon:yes stop_codon:yes gene_type:complete